MANDTFHRPLGRKRWRSDTKRLRDKVNERVDALVNEVKAFHLPLIVENFKLVNPLEEMLMSERELLGSNRMLIHDPDADNEFAVVPIVRLWK